MILVAKFSVATDFVFTRSMTSSRLAFRRPHDINYGAPIMGSRSSRTPQANITSTPAVRRAVTPLIALNLYELGPQTPQLIHLNCRYPWPVTC